jgi:two-component system LytT family response regulator
MIKCVIIDDEQPAINVLKRYIERIPNLELVGTETNPITGIELIKNESPDVVFLDIQMEELNGIEVVKILGDRVKVVFCTAYSEFAVTSYEFDAVDYLMKPIEFNRFLKAVQRVSDVLSHRSSANLEAIPNDYIYVKAGKRGKLLKIDLDDIDYVEALNNYVAFHQRKEQTVAYFSLKELEEKLPSSQFMRIHKSFIVALKQISSMENNELILKNVVERIPVGASYKEAFLEKMKNKLMER